ncbi:uncharacterized protein BYT42DRAFT_543440 [Radiomyces spectabilis]|uniref:uncharacterized protein n=1 Tax=Radiomyces spectabilis TaxID=64574 RepID=UPI00221F4606|nr:uncharacterized protein BYT42DRAFT_543440 [Radiomyces spectabilis]KAI8388071.1 hypothetical protein BYT42DRAFT_543440 [Radiomyces spectabilis]
MATDTTPHKKTLHAFFEPINKCTSSDPNSKETPRITPSDSVPFEPTAAEVAPVPQIRSVAKPLTIPCFMPSTAPKSSPPEKPASPPPSEASPRASPATPSTPAPTRSKPWRAEPVIAESSRAAERRLAMYGIPTVNSTGTDSQGVGFSYEPVRRLRKPDAPWPDGAIFQGGHIHPSDYSSANSDGSWVQKLKSCSHPGHRFPSMDGFMRTDSVPSQAMHEGESVTMNRQQVEALMHKVYSSGWSYSGACRALASRLFRVSPDQSAGSSSSWKEKHSPDDIDCLLGNGLNHTYLRDWLQHMKVSPIVSPAEDSTDQKKKKKKSTFHAARKDDFSFESLSLNESTDIDEQGFLTREAFTRLLGQPEMKEDDDDDFRPSSIRKSKSKGKTGSALKKEAIRSNMILLVGDHGVGKTASVYTAAKEVGYEVFEIHAGSKRSGKDIIGAVGEMTKNHLVTFDAAQQKNTPTATSNTLASGDTNDKKRSRSTDGSPSNKRRPKPQAPAGQNSIMKHFARIPKSSESPPKDATQTSSEEQNKDHKMDVDPPASVAPTVPPSQPTGDHSKMKKSSEPRQSLILLEEVDLLFEDDKGFWPAIVELSQKSKRPIIMTCNDASTIPLESLYLQAVLHLYPPLPVELLPFLQLICLTEGYLIDPTDLTCFVTVIGGDIRQLLDTLEFWCRDKPRNLDITQDGRRTFVKYPFLFGHYMGISDLSLSCPNDIARLMERCGHAHCAHHVDLLRICVHYLGKTAKAMEISVTDEHDDTLSVVANAMERLSFTDAWFGTSKDRVSQQYQEDPRDQVNGFTRLWQSSSTFESWTLEEDMEATLLSWNSQQMKDETWQDLLLEEPSHWQTVCNISDLAFEEYMTAIEPLLPLRTATLPIRESVMSLDIPHICHMLQSNDMRRTFGVPKSTFMLTDTMTVNNKNKRMKDYGMPISSSVS